MTISRRRFLKSAAAAAALGAAAPRAFAQSPDVIRVGIVPLISSGPIFVAQALGLFEKVGLELEITNFADGALAIPALVAGELDFTVTTLNAGLFNAVSRGAPYKLFLDRGSERPGHGSMTMVASSEMFEAGLTSVDRFDLLAGKRLSIQAPGGIDQYLLGRGVQKKGIDPQNGVTWQSGLAYPDIIRAIGAGQCDAAQVPVPLAFRLENEGIGRIIGEGAEIEPNAQLGCWATPSSFIEERRDAAVRFAMVHIHAGRLFNAAAAAKDPEIIGIVSEATGVPAELIEMAAPRWTWFTEDGMPNVESAMAQGSFWSNDMALVNSTVTEEQLFDLSMLAEANAALQDANPFE